MNRKNGLSNLALISQLGINICVPTFVCLFIGLALDNLLNTGCFAVVFLVIGILSGGKSAYDFAVKAMTRDMDKEENPQDIVNRYNSLHGGKDD